MFIIMKKILVLPFLLFISFCVVGQATVDFKKFDEAQLADLIFEQINEVRVKQKIPVLTKDAILYEAAEFHGEYLVNNGKLTHYQTKDKYKKPVNRVRAFGGKHNVVAENVAYQQLQNASITYQELAEEFVSQWVKSSGHYKNIINPRVNQSAVAVTVDVKAGKVYAVQVFGEINVIDSLLDEVPVDAYGIDYSNEKYDQKCTRCKQVMSQKPQEVLYGIYNMDGDIIFSINDPEYFFKIFQHSGDGIAVDILSSST